MRKGRNIAIAILCVLAISAVIVVAQNALLVKGRPFERDVAISGITVSPPIPKVGEQCEISVVVENVGYYSASMLPVKVYVNGTRIGSDVIRRRLDPHRTTTLTFSHTFTSAGVYVITATVGPADDETKVLDNALSIMVITEGGLTTPEISDGAVTSEKIKDETIKSEDIKDGAIQRCDIADDAIDSSKIENGTILRGDIADDAINSSKIEDGSIENEDIKDNTICSEKIKNGTIDAEDLKGGADGAIPHLMASNETTGGYVDDTSFKEVLNTSALEDIPLIHIESGDYSDLIITYCANATNWSGYSPGDKVLIKCNITNLDDGTTYLAEPGVLCIADTYSVNLTNSLTFYCEDLGPGHYFINVSARTTGGTCDLVDQVLTVITLPAPED